MEKKPVTNYEIHVMMQRGMTVEAVIDCVIHANRIIGVGLITLGDALKDYCYKHGGTRRDFLVATPVGDGGEVRLNGTDLRKKDPEAGDDVVITQSFDSPPGIGRTTFRITRVDETGIFGVKTGYEFEEFSGDDMR
jgi:hypothetical protein